MFDKRIELENSELGNDESKVVLKILASAASCERCFAHIEKSHPYTNDPKTSKEGTGSLNLGKRIKEFVSRKHRKRPCAIFENKSPRF